MKFTTKDVTIVAVFTAIMVICSQISVPVPFSPVPITLSLFAVFLSSALLGWKRGTAVQAVYVLLGLCGAPVFQGFTGGMGRVLGPTGGYIISYIFMAFVTGLLTEKNSADGRLKTMGSMLLGLVICYGFGTAWLMAFARLTAAKALAAAVLPFVPLDLVKIVTAAFAVRALKSRLLRANLILDR
ncbi:MAG: biotin transporter BioY [Clostridiales bacterium]|jgi:biotin transport system substrate-specific component|nr:biotin transporter BioY [Clostridiales bacterium]